MCSGACKHECSVWSSGILLPCIGPPVRCWESTEMCECRVPEEWSVHALLCVAPAHPACRVRAHATTDASPGAKPHDCRADAAAEVVAGYSCCSFGAVPFCSLSLAAVSHYEKPCAASCWLVHKDGHVWSKASTVLKSQSMLKHAGCLVANQLQENLLRASCCTISIGISTT